MGLDVFLTILTVICSFQTCLPRRYHFVKVIKNWTEAQSYCREKYTDLATISSAEEMSSLKNTTVMNSSEMAWIGLYNDINSWRWSLYDSHFYGTEEMDYRNWDDGEPNNYLGNNETCAMIKGSGKWNDANCKTSGSFVCFNGTLNSYSLSRQKKNWFEAQSYCQNSSKDLAIVRNQAENDQIQVLLQGLEFVWIGLFRDSWKWSDQSNVSFQLWMSGGPDIGVASEGKNCAVVLLTQTGLWDDVKCTDSHPFFCYSDQSKIKKKQTVRLLVQSSQVVNSPAVKATILEKIQEKLKEQDVGTNITLKWRVISVKKEKNIMTKEKCKVHSLLL